MKNPVDGSVIATVPHMDAADTQLAIEAAHKVSCCVFIVNVNVNSVYSLK